MIQFLKSKMLWAGVAVAVASLFVWDALTGELSTNRSVFNPEAYK